MKRTEQEYDFMENQKYKDKRPENNLKPGFLRRPYSGTKAETKDRTQERFPERHGRRGGCARGPS